MDCAFSLLDEPWIEVQLVDGQIALLGLRDIFRRQDEVRSLVSARPPGMVSIVRLLLAITQRALVHAGMRWNDRDRVNWYRNGLPTQQILDYLEHWRNAFWLFSPDRPFMQAAILAEMPDLRDKVKPWTQIDLSSASGNAPILFDHACDLDPVPIEPALAARYLLEYLSFVPGGLVKAIRDSDKAGPLADTAAVMPMGHYLWQTLCLSLHPYAAKHGEPDLPAWERPAPTLQDLSGPALLASGPNDRYAHLTRAVLLQREPDGLIRWIRFGAGLALEEDPQAPDPMAAYRKGAQAWVRISFTDGRALWRDLPALLPSIRQEHGGKAPAVLGWAASLHRLRLHGDDPAFQPVWVAGLASDQAKLVRWRITQVSLPENLLLNSDDALDFQQFIVDAENLYRELSNSLIRIISDSMPGADSRDKSKAARKIFYSGPCPIAFYSTMDLAIPSVMREFQAENSKAARRNWDAALRRGGLQMWHLLQNALGISDGALRAFARHRVFFFRAIKPYGSSAELSASVQEERA